MNNDHVLYKVASGEIAIGLILYMQWSWALNVYDVKEGLRSSSFSSAIEAMTWNALLEAAGGSTTVVIKRGLLRALRI